jgi:hypothetical protein
MGELTRKLITREKINYTHTDITMNAPWKNSLVSERNSRRLESTSTKSRGHLITFLLGLRSVGTENKVLIAIFYAFADQPGSLEQFDQLLIDRDYFRFGKAFFHEVSAQRIVKPCVKDLSVSVQFIDPEHFL